MSLESSKKSALQANLHVRVIARVHLHMRMLAVVHQLILRFLECRLW